MRGGEVKPFKISDQPSPKQQSPKQQSPKQQSPKQQSPKQQSPKEKKSIKKVLVHTLNMIPSILFIIVNIVKDKKYVIAPTVALIHKIINDNYKDLENTVDNRSFLEKSKNFVIKFSDLFLAAYSRSGLIDKGLILVAFIDIITNEIPNILPRAKTVNYIEPIQVFTKILMNAKEINNEITRVKPT